jgi:hypothetical protein
MGHKEFSWATFDREHERQGEADDAYDAMLAELTRRHAAAMRTNALTGHQQTLEALAEGLVHKLSGSGVTENLIRAALSMGPLGAGQMLLDMIGKCIDADAECEAIKEMERGERKGGLDMNAMLRASIEMSECDVGVV